jgi:hypothetical protein
MYAITGAFGQTGLALSQALLDAGQSIGQRVGHRAHCGKADPFEARSRCLGKCFEKRRRALSCGCMQPSKQSNRQANTCATL